MINNKVIKEVYRKYKKRPASIERVDLDLLSGNVSETHKINISEGRMIIGSVEKCSPFHSLPLSRIHGVVNFEKCVAIVLHSSIIFLEKKEEKVQIHLKMTLPSFWQRVRMFFCRG